MKTLFLILFSTLVLKADPRISSWFTADSGSYARIFETTADETAGNAVTTWDRGQGVQAKSTYAGIHEISSSANWVYLRSTGLASHPMGPWYLNEAKTNLFPNYPANTGVIYRIPRTPIVPANKSGTTLGAAGFYVNGVAMFDNRDAFSYSNSNGTDSSPRNGINGDDVWNRDAYVNESVTFDAGNAHQAGRQYHYHANPPGLRHSLGDSVDSDPSTNTYTENFNGSHSPILAWAADGFPIYGPYGYDDPNNPGSAVRRMIPGYAKRSITNRTTLPQWAADFQNKSVSLPANEYGPPVNATYVIGHYIEDYEFLGTGDLDLYNGRTCITPEFPAGTYAYFVTIEADGTPAFPYAVGREYYGDPTGGTVNNINEAVTIQFEGGPEKSITFDQSAPNSNDLTLTWSAVEGGQYVIESSTTLRDDSWVREVTDAEPTGDKLNLTDTGALVTNSQKFYRTRLTDIAEFDQAGFDFNFTPGTVSLFYLPTDPPLPASVTSASVGGITATVVNYDPATGIIKLLFDDSSLAPGEYPALINGSITSSDTFSIAGPNNVLLLILDDWGIDASELYNTAGPGIQLANMPTLKNLADNGLLFTRGYAQPICSPTRATLLTGRQPYQHGVGNPGANSTLPTAELTFPEIISDEAPNYSLASFGKWHLGSGNTGAFDTGGWPNFTGTLQGGVPDYNDWIRVKIENNALTDSGTEITALVTAGDYSSPYATSVQVDEAVSFITGQSSDPWVVWMGFNAPHTPFHSPPASLAPSGGYSTSGSTNINLYIRSLEALDTEIARLLTSVDLSKTNIIVVGDNGTPGQVDQAPAGGLAGAKGSLNEGGIHVPFFAIGPDVLQTGTSDKLVHVVDLFATVLDLTDVDIPTGIDHHSDSLIPIFNGTDTADRCIIAEVFGQNENDGRSLIMDDWPNYKLISTQDVSDPNDTPVYQMYLLGANGVEASTLTTPPNPGEAHETAYLALVAKDQSLSPDSSGDGQIVNIDLPANAPPLINTNNGNIVRPNGITIGGVAATWDTGNITDGGTTTSAARVDESGDPARFSVVADFDVATSGLTSGQSYDIIVSFPGAGGTSRLFTATNQFLVP